MDDIKVWIRNFQYLGYIIEDDKKLVEDNTTNRINTGWVK